MTGHDDDMDISEPERVATIDRAEQLHALTEEHRHGIAFAEQIAQIARTGDDADLVRGIEMVRSYNAQEMEAHLQHEEQTIFGPLIRNHKQYVDMCIQLGKEHGYLRTLVECMTVEGARNSLANFAHTLKNHTLLEEEWLFPIIESTLTDDELQAVLDFVPLQAQTPPQPTQDSLKQRQAKADNNWLEVVAEHHTAVGEKGGSIVLFPRYQPELAIVLAEHLGLEFFDLRDEFMENYGYDADRISFDTLEQALRDQARQSGFICHNIEALLCVKSEQERRSWLGGFLDSPWPNPILLPITVHQGDVAEQHPRVCDLELFKLPCLSTRTEDANRIKYDIESGMA